jgi:hypothetical protein
MRDLTNPLALSLFDGGGDDMSRTRKRNQRKVARKREKNAPKTSSKYGEARGISTKTEKKGPVYVSKKQQAKTCANSLPTGSPGGGRD